MREWPVYEDHSWWKRARHLVRARLNGTIKTFGEKCAWADEVSKCPQKVRMWIADQLDVREEYIEVEATPDGAGGLVVMCPWCKRQHIHGAGGGPGPRLSHCVTGKAQQYILVLKKGDGE